jgi:guanylate kinase
MRFTSKDLPALAIIGPSGAGKSTAIRQLVDDGVVHVNPTWTTRPPRPGEVKTGVEHYFATEQAFSDKKRAGYFVETVQLFGLPYWYGLSPLVPSVPGKASVVMLRAPLLPLFNKYYPNNVVYQIEDDLDRIKQRLEERAAHGEDQGSRLDDYTQEVQAGRSLANRIFVNNDMNTLVSELRQALAKDFGE